jgi:RNA polymerase sigma factor (sigma-70 family)
MATAQLGQLRQLFDRVRDADHGDGELLTRYRTMRDQDAFGSLVRRHGPMVLGVCRRVLRDHHAADDAFQATFLVLAKKADAVRPPDRLAPWLYGVAYRTALKARGRAFRRRQVEQAYAAQTSQATHSTSDDTDLRPVIDEQLNALPEKYRTPLVLCAIQGLNKAEAAERLGLPEGTVSSRLARAREMLRDRLARRGFVVPATAFAALLTADTLQAAVPPALAATAAGAAGSSAVPATVLTLTHEVIRSMTLLKLKFLGAIALSVSLVGGGVGLVAVQAQEKKPTGEKPVVKPEKPVGEKPVGEKPEKPVGEKPEKPTTDKPEKPKPDGDKPKPTGEKPEKPATDKPKPAGEKPAAKIAGKVAGVDPKENTITVAFKTESGIVEKFVQLNANTKVFIDGKEAKLADVPKNSTAAFVSIRGTKDGVPPEITEVRITGSNVTGVIDKVDASSITLESEKEPRTFKVTPGTQVTLNGKAVKPADLPVGGKVLVVLSADESAALSIVSGTKPAPDGEKPAGTKPAKFGGKVAAVDAAARTITLGPKGEGGKEMVVKITADAKITVDGKDAKIADIPKGVTATFNLASAKDGQLREVNEVTVAGPTFFGTVKQIDATSITVGTEKSDRVFKLATVGKVMIGEKEGKVADLKVGDRVSVTLSSDESAAVLIVGGVKKSAGDKIKPDKEDEPDDDQ